MLLESQSQLTSDEVQDIHTEAKIQTRTKIYESPWLLASVKPYTWFPYFQRPSPDHPLSRIFLTGTSNALKCLYFEDLPAPDVRSPPSCSIALARGASLHHHHHHRLRLPSSLSSISKAPAFQPSIDGRPLPLEQILDLDLLTRSLEGGGEEEV